MRQRRDTDTDNRGTDRQAEQEGQAWAGFQRRGGGGGPYGPLARPPSHPKKGSTDGPPKTPTETDPGAPEVTRTQNSAKNDNGNWGISASREFRKVITCHVFG